MYLWRCLIAPLVLNSGVPTMTNDSSACSEGGGRNIPLQQLDLQVVQQVDILGRRKGRTTTTLSSDNKDIHGISWDKGNWKQNNCGGNHTRTVDPPTFVLHNQRASEIDHEEMQIEREKIIWKNVVMNMLVAI